MMQNYLYHYGQGGDGGGSPYGAPLQAAIDYANLNAIALPDDAALSRLNTLFDSIATQWAKFQYFGVYFRHNAQAFGNINFAAPSLGGALNSGATWTNNNGYAGNGASAFVNLGVIPSFQNDASVGAFVTTTSTGGSDQLVGQIGGTNIALRNRSVVTQRINQTSNGVASGGNVLGLHAISRSGPSSYTNFWPSGSLTNTIGSATVLASNVCILRSGPGYGNASVGAAWVGASIAPSDYAAIAAAFAVYSA